MKTVLFARVSSREQEETGYSLPAQEKLLFNYATKNNFRVVKKFSISESASGKNQRKTFNEMIKHVTKNNIKIIICEKADRLTRNFKDMVDIDRWLDKDEERQIHLVKDSLILHKNSRSQEKLNWGIRVLFAKNYIDNLSEEVRKGTKEKARQGWYPGNNKRGYVSVGEKGHKIWKIDTSEKSEAPLIKRAFELYDSGNYSLKSLRLKLFDDGWRTNEGKPLYKSTLHNVLTDGFYCGEFKWQGIHYRNGKHKPLISKELFQRVQKKLQSKTTPKYSKHNFLFKGLIKCYECKGTITWEIQKGHVYGHCNHYRKCSQKKWPKEHEVEDQLVGVFDNLQIKNKRLMGWIRKALKESHKDEIEYRTSAIKELYQRQERLRKRLDRLYEDKLDDKISEEFHDRKAAKYQRELDEVTEKIKTHDNANIKYYKLGLNIYDLSQRAKEIYLKAKKEKRRQLLNLVFNKMLLDEGRLNYTYNKAFAILAEAVKFTNSSKMLKTGKSEDKIFEPEELIADKRQRGYLYLDRPALLRG